MCYRKHGPLAITDANVHLGRVLPQYFPHIFGADERQPLDADATAEAFEKLTAEINAHAPKAMTSDEVAYGFVKVANESMCRPIRSITEAKGYDAVCVHKHTVSPFISVCLFFYFFYPLERACACVFWRRRRTACMCHCACVRHAHDCRASICRHSECVWYWPILSRCWESGITKPSLYRGNVGRSL